MPSKRKQVYLAVAGSVGIHLAVLFAWAFTVRWFPGAQAAVKSPEEIKLQVVEEKPATPPPTEPALVPATPTPPPHIFQDLADLPEASRAPKDAAFESGKNTEAASELPANGDKPLPTQQGRQAPTFAFDPHPYTAGDAGQAAGQNVPENMPPPAPPTEPPPPRPAVTPVAQATPPREPPAATIADPRDMAMVTPKSLPAAPVDAEPNPYDPSFRPPASVTEPPRPTPVPRRGGYQPMAERTDATGGINQFGANSVASTATPAGRYIASVKNVVDHRYHQYVDARVDLVVLGTVKVRFAVNRDGKVIASRVVSNSANEALASVSLSALANAPIPPMPAEVAASFKDGELHMEIYFGLED